VIRDLADNFPATTLSPHFNAVYDMVVNELNGLTSEQLDFESDEWEWSKWSIRRQVSHMASLHFRWILQRWGQYLFPDGLPAIEDLNDLISSPNDRRLNEKKYWEIASILRKLREAIELTHSIFSSETIGSLREKEIARDSPSNWKIMAQAHPRGIRWDSAKNPTVSYITLEATIRHMYFEDITHLYNIQRLKRAQDLVCVVVLPNEGYWVLPDWDRSEP